jgi:hypothetical protein
MTITTNRTKIGATVLLIALAVGGRLVRGEYGCGYLGSQWRCEWGGESASCSYFEYECINMCETEPAFSCTSGSPLLGTSGWCSCTS